jgi:hypothetical protein
MKKVKSIACPICGDPITHAKGVNVCYRCNRQYTNAEMLKFPIKEFPLSKFTDKQRSYERSA